ncbi:hypothetical protein pb186bvf_005942 [Paramecium bursaria]
MGNLCDSQVVGKTSISIPLKVLEDTDSTENTQQPTSPSKRRISKIDFVDLGLVAKGSFGKVHKVMKKDTGTIYAMKIINKQDIFEYNLEANSFIERNVLKASNCPFLVKLSYAFQSQTKCYFVMDYVQGGELFKLLQKYSGLPETVVVFLVAEIVIALEYLHNTLNVIYRDLKPENVMLTENGHVKLTDFGLATAIKDPNSFNYTMAGTPEYLAPEIITKAGHTKEVDLWTLGILVYEMLAGYAPFYDPERNTNKIQSKIMQNKPVFTAKMSSNARNLIQGLLRFNPKDRLGSKSFDDLKRHPFFSKIDFENIQNMKSPIENQSLNSKLEIDAQLQPGHECNEQSAAPEDHTKLRDFTYDSGEMK